MPISFSCNGCGQAYKVPDDAAGKTTKCRKCGTVVDVPMTSALASKPTAPPPPPVDAFNFNADEPNALVSPKKKKSKKVLIFALFGLMFAFFGCCLMPGTAGLAYYFFFMPADDLGLKYMPDNPQVIASSRTQEAMNSEFVTLLKKELPDDKEWNDRWKEMSTDSLWEDTERSVAGFNATTMEWSSVAFMRKPVDLPKLLASKAFKERKFKEVKVGKYTVYEDQSGQANDPLLPTAFQQVSLCAPEPRILLVGSSQTLQAILKRNRDATLTDSMKAILKRADMKKAFAVAADVKSIKAKYPKESESLKRIKGGDKIDAAIVTIDVKKDIAVDMVLICEDGASAENLRKAIEGLATVAGMGVEGLGGPGEVKEVIDAAKFAARGKEMLGSAVIKQTVVAKGIRKSLQGKRAIDEVVPNPGQRRR